MIFFLLALGLVEILLGMHGRNLEKSDHQDALIFATDLRDHTEKQLNRVLHQTSGLSSYFSVRRDDLEREEVENILRIAHQTSRHVRNFGVAVGYQLTYIYPIKGNEAAVNLDYRTQLQQWPDVETAVTARRAVLSEQVQLLQGGQALINREPIFIDEKYWGLLSTVIDSDEFFTDTFGNINQNNYLFAVRGARNHLLWGDERLFDDPAAVLLLSERNWLFAVKSVNNIRRLPQWVLRLMGLAIVLASTFGLYSVLSHRRALAHLALYDSVTGLPNRTLLNDRIEHALLLARRKPEEGLVVIFIDLDDFKIINDTYGHRAGDFVLKNVAQRLETCARVGDTAARWAGDEFILLVEHLRENEIEPLLERVTKAIAEALYHEGHRLQITASVGYAVAFKDADTAADLIWAADRRMYASKMRRKQIHQ